MSPTTPPVFIEVAYEEYARQYLRSLPLSHFMEATDQARQRAITVESLALVAALRGDFHVYNELLVQYPLKGKKRPGQVVPDNMVVVSKESIRATTCFNTPVEPAGPFWVMEYVSKNNKRKDYEDSFRKYEQDLKVPYYLIFYPDTQDLTLYHHAGEKYESVEPNELGRYAIPEVDIELALLEGWVRYWYKGRLLPLPEEMQRELHQLQDRLDAKDKALRAAEAENARLRALLDQREKKG